MKMRIDEIDIIFEEVKEPPLTMDIVEKIFKYYALDYPYNFDNLRKLDVYNIERVLINENLYALLYMKRYLFTAIILFPRLRDMKKFRNLHCKVYDLKNIEYTRSIRDGKVVIEI